MKSAGNIAGGNHCVQYCKRYDNMKKTYTKMDEKRKKFTEASRLDFTNSPGTHNFNYFERQWKCANRDM